jgi:predicted metalloprotease with PDZ domain
MKARALAATAVLVLLVALPDRQGRAQTSRDVMSYHVTYDTAAREFLSIELSWTTPLSEARALVMPRAIPMGYGEQRYDAFVSDVRAYANAVALPAPSREEGPRWRVPAHTTRLTYRVDVQQMERDVRAASDASRLREGYVSALGYSIFAFLDGEETRSVHLRIEAPADWPVFSTLAPRTPAAIKAVDVQAVNFYALADSQIVMGPGAVFRRIADEPAPCYLAVYAEGPVDVARLATLAAQALQRVAAYFGGVPFSHYTIHQELLLPISPQHEYGMSMEHLDSSTYYLAAATGLTADSPLAEEARVLYNFAHHIAHAWIPKRAYGPGYFPFQWELAPVLDSIWFAEGFGQYAAIMALAAGTPDPAAFRDGMLSRRFRPNIATAPPFLKALPLIELSRVASTRYAEDFRTGRLLFSRGGLMAAAIDDRIQAETKGARSLRDALRFIVEWSARERRAFTLDELPGLIEQATSVQTRAVIDTWLRPMSGGDCSVRFTSRLRRSKL